MVAESQEKGTVCVTGKCEDRKIRGGGINGADGGA